MRRIWNPGMPRQLEEKHLLYDALSNDVAMEGLCPDLNAFFPPLHMTPDAVQNT